MKMDLVKSSSSSLMLLSSMLLLLSELAATAQDANAAVDNGVKEKENGKDKDVEGKNHRLKEVKILCCFFLNLFGLLNNYCDPLFFGAIYCKDFFPLF